MSFGVKSVRKEEKSSRQRPGSRKHSAKCGIGLPYWSQTARSEQFRHRGGLQSLTGTTKTRKKINQARKDSGIWSQEE
jgi:hypothetical protein